MAAGKRTQGAGKAASVKLAVQRAKARAAKRAKKKFSKAPSALKQSKSQNKGDEKGPSEAKKALAMQKAAEISSRLKKKRDQARKAAKQAAKRKAARARKKELAALKLKMNVAAAVIQLSWRSVMARRNLAASIIQLRWKLHFDNLNAAANKLEQFWRSTPAHQRFEARQRVKAMCSDWHSQVGQYLFKPIPPKEYRLSFLQTTRLGKKKSAILQARIDKWKQNMVGQDIYEKQMKTNFYRSVLSLKVAMLKKFVPFLYSMSCNAVSSERLEELKADTEKLESIREDLHKGKLTLKEAIQKTGLVRRHASEILYTRKQRSAAKRALKKKEKKEKEPKPCSGAATTTEKSPKKNTAPCLAIVPYQVNAWDRVVEAILLHQGRGPIVVYRHQYGAAWDGVLAKILACVAEMGEGELTQPCDMESTVSNKKSKQKKKNKKAKKAAKAKKKSSQKKKKTVKAAKHEITSIVPYQPYEWDDVVRNIVVHLGRGPLVVYQPCSSTWAAVVRNILAHIEARKEESRPTTPSSEQQSAPVTPKKKKIEVTTHLLEATTSLVKGQKRRTQNGIQGEDCVQVLLDLAKVPRDSYKTEEEMKEHNMQARRQHRTMPFARTPDFLFRENVIINGKECAWIDSKDVLLVPGLTPAREIESLQRQIDDYTHMYGPGAIIWHGMILEDTCDLFEHSDQVAHFVVDKVAMKASRAKAVATP